MKEGKSGFVMPVMPLGIKCIRKNNFSQTLAKTIGSPMKLKPRPVKITIPASLQLTTSKVSTSQKVELIDKNTEFEKNPQKEYSD